MLVVEHSGGVCGVVGLLARFFSHVDSSHSGLITTNSRGLAAAWPIQEGVIIKEKNVR